MRSLHWVLLGLAIFCCGFPLGHLYAVAMEGQDWGVWQQYLNGTLFWSPFAIAYALCLIRACEIRGKS